MGISALSYIEIPHNVPGPELLRQTTDERTNTYLEGINEPKTVYAIKKYTDGRPYEHELYFYTYDPKRKDPLVLEFDGVQADICKYSNCVLNWTNFIIMSFDLNSDFFEHGSSETNFYYERFDDEYPYFVLEESRDGIIRMTNRYGLIRTEMKFTEPDSIMFFAEKPYKGTCAVYYEKMSFQKFLEFLAFFKYDQALIQFCRDTYDDTYKFCVSYDYDSEMRIIKSTIFSTLS
ncbi:hypothetical protein EBT31_03515 [bacterium]|nr:hypothetical protein [bacterium]NBX48689.1 hypothetical protein [bacterium]